MKPTLGNDGEFRRLVLRGGAKARLVTLEGPGDRPIVVLLEKEPWVVRLDRHGRFLDLSGEHRLDIQEHDIYILKKEM